MSSLQVVLVEPRSSGNVGAVARIMANFGLERLTRVGGCELDEEAFQRAVHASDILTNSRRVGSLAEALDGLDLTVGSTSVPGVKEEAFHRHALSPEELAARLREVEGSVGLFLGREDYGLYNHELGLLDLVVTVPTHPAYPAMNLSHAAAVLLYELRKSAVQRPRGRRLASGFEKERLHKAFHEFLVESGYEEHKRRRTELLFRRLMARALPTKWEFHTLMGVFIGASKSFRRGSEFPE